MKIIREFVIRHMKADGEKVVLSEKLNQLVWARSIQKPPRRVKVRIVKDDEYIRAYLADEKVEDLKKADTKKEEAKKPETEKDEAKK
jgi:large subunit ribosomal protein L31e